MVSNPAPNLYLHLRMLEGRQRKNSCLQLLWIIAADDAQNAKNRVSGLYDAAVEWKGQKALAADTELGLPWDT